MKKTLLIALAAIATIFTSCSSDITNDDNDSNNGQGKGMTLIANVEQPDTRATLDTKETFGTWKFEYTDNDQVSVGNNLITDYYTFTKNGEKFSCADAKATSTAANWYAYYPSTNINLTNQAGTVESAATLYALAGATETATTGANGLTINMAPKAAVLRIVKVDNYGPCDIFLKTTGGYVKGLKAKKNEVGYEVETSESQVSVFKKESNGNAGIYYVIVPAGVYLEVWNKDRKFKTTSKGLTAGKYYTLTSGPTTGSATAKFSDGTTEKVEWVQMWIGGPRIAVKNASDKMIWTEARKTGDDYIWGKNWRTASSKEVEIMGKKAEYGTMLNNDILTGTYEYNNTIHGFTLKGEQPGYTSNKLFLSGNDKSNAERVEGDFWVTDELNNGYATTMTFIGNYDMIFAFPMQKAEPNSPQEVRPVLTIDTVLWGE